MNFSGAAEDKRPLNAIFRGLNPEELFLTFDLSQTIVRRLDGTIVFCTAGICRLYGWAKEEMVGRVSHELLQTEFPAPLEEIENDLLKHGGWTGELKHVRRDGSNIWVASHWALQTDQYGDPTWVVEVNNDLTGIKLALDVQPRQSDHEAGFTRLSSLNEKLLAVADPRAALSEILDSLCEIIGAEAGSVVEFHTQTRTLKVAATKGCSENLLDESLQTGAAWSAVGDAFVESSGLAIRVETGDGEESSGLHWFDLAGYPSMWCVLLRSGAGHALGVFSTYFRRQHRPSEHDARMFEMHARLATDCLERMSAQSALTQSEFLNKQIIDNTPECIFVLDVTLEGRFKFVELNPSEEKAVGLSSAEVAGKFIEDVLTEDVVRAVTPKYRLCVESGTPIDYEGELSLAIGPRYFRTHLIPIRDATGRTCRLVGCCHDLTDTRRNYQEALAQQKLETIGVLASGIAHDFNNLLGGILASAELALSEKGEHAAVDDELRRIRTASIRGAEIVRELMIYGGKESAALEAVDASALVEEMLQLLKIAVSKNAIVEAKLPRYLPAVQANPTQLRQVVMNLVTNASEAIGGNSGIIRVSTSLVKVDNNSYSETGLSPGDYLVLEVSDNGSGIVADLQGKVFDPFFTTKRDGRGLGLSIVQGIVRAHHGAITLVSELGKGTTFRVLLPALNKSTHPHKSSSPAAIGNSINHPATIMIVEDEEVLRNAVSKALRKRNFSVLEASTGSTAIDLLESHKREVSLVLLDVTLPGMTIREIYKNLKRVQPSSKVIFTSAYGRETVAALLGELPLERFIRKPFQLSDLVDVLDAATSE